jgi:hypothetical protein
MAEERQTIGQPHDRLTRICDGMIKTFEAHPEHHQDDKCIIFLDSERRGGLVLSGYEDHAEAMVNLFMHMRAVFRANGQDLDIISLDDDGVTRA